MADAEKTNAAAAPEKRGSGVMEKVEGFLDRPVGAIGDAMKRDLTAASS